MASPDKAKQTAKRGPKPKRLKVEGDWVEALEGVMKEANKQVAKPKEAKSK